MRLLQIFPGELLEPTYTDPDNSERLVGRSEVDRRQQHFSRLDSKLIGGQSHPCVLLIKDCLRNNPLRRPTAEALLTRWDDHQFWACCYIVVTNFTVVSICLKCWQDRLVKLS